MINTTDVPEIGEAEAAKAVDASPKKETALGKRSANEDNSPAASTGRRAKARARFVHKKFGLVKRLPI